MIAIGSSGNQKEYYQHRVYYDRRMTSVAANRHVNGRYPVVGSGEVSHV